MNEPLAVDADLPCGTVGRTRVIDERTVEIEVQSSREFGIEGSLETWVCGRLTGHREDVEVRVTNEHGNMRFLRPVARMPGAEWRPVVDFGEKAVGREDVFAFTVPAAAGEAVEFATWWPYELGHLEALFSDLAATSVATVATIGHSTHERALRSVTIEEGPGPRRTLVVVAGFHGGEPSSLWAADALLRHAASPAGAALRRDLRIVAVPVVNVDALAEGLDRRSAAGLNLWLDAEAASAPEVVAVDVLVRQAAPDAILDLHSWHWQGDGCFTPGWISAGDDVYREIMRLRAAIDCEFPLSGQLHFSDDESFWMTRMCRALGVPIIDVEVTLARGSDGSWKTLDRARDDGLAILRGTARYLASVTT